PAAQALGDEARRVAELLDHLPDARRRLLRDAVAVVDHLRDGRDRDTGCGGDVRDRDGTVGHGARYYRIPITVSISVDKLPSPCNTRPAMTHPGHRRRAVISSRPGLQREESTS